MATAMPYSGLRLLFAQKALGCGTANRASSFEGVAAIFHGHFLRVLYLGLLLAFDAIGFCHGSFNPFVLTGTLRANDWPKHALALSRTPIPLIVDGKACFTYSILQAYTNSGDKKTTIWLYFAIVRGDG
jgi:hypothetical protein